MASLATLLPLAQGRRGPFSGMGTYREPTHRSVIKSVMQRPSAHRIGNLRGLLDFVISPPGHSAHWFFMFKVRTKTKGKSPTPVSFGT